MSVMVDRDVALLVDAARGILATLWPDAVASASADLREVWTAGARQGWFELASEDELRGALAVARVLGEVGCPVPVLDGFVASRLLDGATDSTVLDGITEGTVRVVVAQAGDHSLRHVEAGDTATHLLVLPYGAGPALLHPIEKAVPESGLALPAWSQVTLGPASAQVELDLQHAEDAVTLVRLGLAARACAAAGRTRALALEHAKTRTQFGKVIGSFGAVSQRAAHLEIEFLAMRSLVDDAVTAYVDQSPDWRLAAALAVEYSAAVAPRIQLGALHTLAAIGLHEEHEGPWLFRRVNADIARLALVRPQAGTVADVLVETGQSLPHLQLGPDAEAFRAEVREVIGRHRRDNPAAPFADGEAVLADVVEHGWLAMGLPASAGGRSASFAEQVVLHDELRYARVPGAMRPLAAVMLIGGAILRHGTEEQQAEYLPMIARGEIDLCVGYSEPEVGSDLASLRTRAERDGDGWVINGQKIWTTRGNTSSHVWLAVRTDPDAHPRHAGITVFLLPMDTPGITVSPHVSLTGEITCSVFYDDVRVPDSARVGPVNEGWKVIGDALQGERALISGYSVDVLRQLDDVLELARRDPGGVIGPRGSAGRALLGKLAVRLQGARVVTAMAQRASANGEVAAVEVPAASVLSSELAEDFGLAMLELFGPDAALSVGEPDVPGSGWFEAAYRMSIKAVVGGGTNDVMRGVIARRLGLPR